MRIHIKIYGKKNRWTVRTFCALTMLKNVKTCNHADHLCRSKTLAFLHCGLHKDLKLNLEMLKSEINLFIFKLEWSWFRGGFIDGIILAVAMNDTY